MPSRQREHGGRTGTEKPEPPTVEGLLRSEFMCQSLVRPRIQGYPAVMGGAIIPEGQCALWMWALCPCCTATI
eukprot:scaffold299422_cov32-Tisochrysis_lutea.AAC.2